MSKIMDVLCLISWIFIGITILYSQDITYIKTLGLLSCGMTSVTILRLIFNR